MASSLVTLDWAFSKGINYWKGDNLIPKEYSNWLRNIRINNGWIVLRTWYESVIETFDYTNMAMIIDNQWPDTLTTVKLFFVAKNDSTWFFEFCKLLNNNTILPVWVISTTALLDNRISYVVYERYLIILIWNTYPFLYDSSTWTFITLTPTEFPSWKYPISWWTLWTRTVLWLWSTLYFSQQVLWDTTISNCYKFIGWDSKQNTLDWKIIWILQWNDELYVFTTLSIYRVSYNIWSNQFVTDKLWDGWILANQFSACMAWNKVFYLTNDWKIRTIQYQPWIVNQMIADISDTVLWWIDELFNWNINDDVYDFTWFSNYSFSFFDSKENLIKIYLPTINIHKIDPISDWNYIWTCIIWDLVNQCFLLDDSKPFSYETYNRYLTFTGLWYNNSEIRIYKENNIYTDRTQNIVWEFQKIINLWNPTIKKNWRWISISWKINDKSNFYIGVYIDDKLINTYKILWLTKTKWNVWYYHFNHVITQGNLRNKWNVLKLRFYTTDLDNTTNYSLILDYIDISYLPVWKYRLWDKKN